MDADSSSWRGRAAASALFLASCLAGGCALAPEPQPVPPAPHAEWRPAVDDVPAKPSVAVAAGASFAELNARAREGRLLPPDMVALVDRLGTGPLDLPLAIDLALRGNDRTRETWLAARAAAA